MKKDIFKGNIKSEFIDYIKVSIGFASVLFLGIGITMLCLNIFKIQAAQEVKIGLYVFSGLSILFSILYPILSIYSIRTYPKHKKLAHALIKQFVFVEKRTDL